MKGLIAGIVCLSALWGTQVQALETIQGGPTRVTTVASGLLVAGDSTPTTAVVLPRGPKSFYGQVVCSSGSCVQTQSIYGGTVSTLTATTGVLLCTMTLSATTAAYDACPVITANFSWFMVVTSSTSGTSATGAVYAMY